MTAIVLLIGPVVELRGGGRVGLPPLNVEKSNLRASGGHLMPPPEGLVKTFHSKYVSHPVKLNARIKGKKKISALRPLYGICGNAFKYSDRVINFDACEQTV